MNTARNSACLLLPLSLAIAPPAAAQTTQSVTASAETQDFSDGRGSLRTGTLEYKIDLGDTTVVASPTIGTRRVAGASATATAMGGAVYHDWSDRFSTRTQAFVAEQEPVFAHLDFAQDVTVKVAENTTITAGARWAEFFADREVSFVSIGARRYFKGGSIAYRLTRVNPDNRGAYFGHLVNLSVNDARGKGKTQLWLSTGAASATRLQLESNLAGKDRALMLRRTQPLNDRLALVASAGVSSYANPGNRVTSTTFGLGLSVAID